MPIYRNIPCKLTREQRQAAKAAAERHRLKEEQAKRNEFVRNAVIACLVGDYSVDLSIDRALRAQCELEKKVPALFRVPKEHYNAGYMPVAAYGGCEPLAGADSAAPKPRKPKKTKTKE